MVALASSRAPRGLPARRLNDLLDWFIPVSIRERRADRALARTFVFTHLFGPLIAQPMWLYILAVSRQATPELLVLAVAICSFWLLPFVLRATGSIRVVALTSFQGLTLTSLFGAYFYGGFISPFTPWIVVSLLVGLLYLPKSIKLVMTLFCGNVAAFLFLVAAFPPPSTISVDELDVLGWLSIGSATVYMTWMALHYSAMVGMKEELEIEASRSRAASEELERMRAIAEQKSRARSRFFSKMSHELRTPLNAIIGYSEILLEDLEDGNKAAHATAEDVRSINTAGKHLLSLVADVLDDERIEDEAVRIDPTPFTLGTLLEAAVSTSTPLIKKNGNRLVTSCPQPGRMVFTDQKKLRQVVINLLGNAAKFTSGGEVRLEILLELGPHDDFIRINVQDTGIGISREAMARLFGEYQQADASVSSTYGGTGMGLAISRQFCIMLGGDIAVESDPGQGSLFSVSVPAHFSSSSDCDAPLQNEADQPEDPPDE